jgi:hypothetical protein
VVAFNSLIF